jgi:parallel beta-helix repeat protein
MIGAIWIVTLSAVPRNVAAEVFTPTCQSCGSDFSSARSALIQLAQEHGDIVPLSYIRTAPASPGALDRYARYGGDPAYEEALGQFDGVLQFLGDEAMNDYSQFYTERAGQQSPIAIDPEFHYADGILTATAHIALESALANANRELFFALTRFDDTNYCHEVIAFDDVQPFTLLNAGDTATFTYTLPCDSLWILDQLRAVVLVQSADTNEILQSIQTPLTDLVPRFTASGALGPASLGVTFIDGSLPVADVITWAWDFDNDGVIDSHEQNPYHVYDTPGTYSVSLTVSTATETATLTQTDVVVVTDGSSVSGTISGVWSPEHGEYSISDDVTIPYYGQLVIQPGTVINTGFGKKITVFGQLLADATNGETIHFTGDPSWKGIKIINSGSDNILRNCRIDRATLSGIYVSSSRAVIENCMITDNSSASLAAGIDLFATDSVLVSGNIIANNSASSNAGGISIRQGSPTVRNNIIVNNEGLYSVYFSANANGAFTNNTIANNTATTADIVIESSSPTLQNNIVRSRTTAVIVSSGTPVVEYNNMPFNGTGNIDTDPLFSNPSTGYGDGVSGLEADWRITSSSPSVDAGNPDPIFNDYSLDGAPVYALGSVRNDQGAYGGPTPSLYSSSLDTDAEIIPVPVTGFHLQPNPFNPETTLRFTLATEQPVRIDVFNTRGERIAILFDNRFPAGSHSITWNGRDRNGTLAASGVYIMRMMAGGKAFVQKAMMLK